MPLNVLICDDSAMSRKMVRRAIPKALSDEIELTQAANGVEAMEAYHLGKADLMFLDMTMPVMDGFAVLEQLQKEEAKTIVIVISADIQPEVQEKVFAMGAAAFIKKPVSPETLKRKILDIGIL